MKIVADNNFSCDSMILCAAVPTIHYLDVNRYRGQYEVILKLVLLLLWNNCDLDFRHHRFQTPTGLVLEKVMLKCLKTITENKKI